MPYLILTYAPDDQDDQIVEVTGEPRLSVDQGRSIALHTTMGLHKIEYVDDLPEKKKK